MNTTCIIPCAGRGSRMTEYTKNRFPKSLLTINGKSVIEWNIDSLISQGVDNFIIIVNNEENILIDLIMKKYSSLGKFNFVPQQELLGPLHAIYLGVENIRDKKTNILIILGDGIYLDEMCLSHDCVYFQEVTDYSRWCLVETHNDAVLRFIDKPTLKPTTNKALIGVYFLTNISYFKSCCLRVFSNNVLINNEFQISSALEFYLFKHRIMAVETKNWFDCGSPDNYKKAIYKLEANPHGRPYDKA